MALPSIAPASSDPARLRAAAPIAAAASRPPDRAGVRLRGRGADRWRALAAVAGAFLADRRCRRRLRGADRRGGDLFRRDAGRRAASARNPTGSSRARSREASADAVAVTDRAGRLVCANDRYEALFGGFPTPPGCRSTKPASPR